jgi:class 3 adenylate cyclase/tetratricopeptide (TPR) repeat protein
MECGNRLNAGCPTCGAQNPPNAKFCGDCGTVLSETAAPGQSAINAQAAQSGIAAPTAERRLVTVLFADLVGFTAMSQDQDPEDTREFLTRYFELARTIVDRYGGTIEKFIGDAVMAVWGAPTTHEDDAERAVRAALEIVDGVPGLRNERTVQARAGVLTGQAAVTIGASGQGMVAGDLVNTASRLQSVAPAGAVLVGDTTMRAAGTAVRFEEAGEQLLKGKSAPVPAWRAAAVVALRGGTARSDALEPPFVGRDEDLRLIKELFHSTQREQKARLVSVVGQGGMGKSRLAWEFEKYIDGVVGSVWWHHGRSPAYGEGISYWALAEMVRGRAGIAETDDAGTSRDKLRTSVAEWIADDEERRWVEPRLAGLLALEPMPPGSRDELFAAWRAYFDRIAQRGPVVLVFEDIQWADEGLLDFVTELLDRSRNAPIFVVALARPELFDRRTGWGSNLRSLTTMHLEPLDKVQMQQLVNGTVPGIPADATTAIVDRAEGIPLYAVETMRMLLDRGDLVRTDSGEFEMRGRLEGLAVPETLQALIAARLDALGERDRRLIQTASILGLSFTSEALAAMTGDQAESLHDALAGLVRRQMLQVEIDPRSPERGQYQFVQAVVREVAEGSLSRADRRSMHLAAARFYESLGDDELVAVQASHYVEAYHATPAGPEAEALAAQARVSLRSAADRAIALRSNRLAVAYVEQALEVTPDRADRALLHERAILPASDAGMIDKALEHVEELERITREQGDDTAHLHALTLHAMVMLGEHQDQTAISLLQPAVEVAIRREWTNEMSAAAGQLARAYMLAGTYDKSIDWSDRVLAHPKAATDDLLIDVLTTKGTSLGSIGRGLEGETLLRGAIQVAEESGNWWAALRARNNVMGDVAANDIEAAAQLLADGYDLATRYGFNGWALQFAHTSLIAGFESGNWDAWIAECRDANASPFYVAWRLSDEARRDAMRGDVETARQKMALGVGEANRSTQGRAGFAGVRAVIDLAEGDWSAAMAGAREQWSVVDGIELGTMLGACIAAGANEADWANEAVQVVSAHELRGALIRAHGDGLRAVAALLEGRWSDARAAFLSARGPLDSGHARFTLALLNLAIGSRGGGHVPEAAEALAGAREFFAGVGAESFVDRYLRSLVPSAPASRASVAADRSEVAAS